MYGKSRGIINGNSGQSDSAIKSLPLLNKPGLPANKNKYDGAAPKLVVQPVNHTAGVFTSTGASTDNVNTFEGNPTAKITSTGSNALINFNLGADTNLTGYEFVDLYVRIDNMPQMVLMQVEFSNIQTFADSYRITAVSTWTSPSENGWRYYRIPISTFLYNGTGATTWSNIHYFKVTARCNSGQTLNVNIGKVQMTKAPAKAKMFLYYDDGYDNQYDKGYVIAKANGLKGTIGVMTYKVNQPADTNAYITWAQLKDMEANGWMVACHTHNHIDLTSVDEATMRADLSASVNLLRQNGFMLASRCLVAPYGGWNATVDAIARDYFSLCRTNFYAGGTHSINTHQSHPRIQRYFSPLNTDSVATVQSWIDTAITNKDEICIAWHQIKDTNPTANTYTYLTADYTTIIQYIKSKVDAGLIEVVTWKDTMLNSNAITPVNNMATQYLALDGNNKISIVQI